MTAAIRSGPAILAALLLTALSAVPLFGPRYLVTMLAEVFIMAIVAMSLDLLVGYTGLVSLGHAALFASAAYAAGLIATKVTPLFWVTLPAGVLTAALLALLVGSFALRTSAITFLMITLAAGQMIYALVFKWDLMGGSDGLAGIPRPTGFGFEMNAYGLYWLSLLAMLLVYLLLRRILESPFGRVLVGIRENPGRMQAIGADVQRYKLIAFVIAGAIAGVGGVLFAHFVGHVSPEAAAWSQSSALMLMVIIGGRGTLVGPMLGSFLILVLQNLVSSWTDRWMLIMGLVFIVFVLGLRVGLVGLWREYAGRLRARRAEGRPAA